MGFGPGYADPMATEKKILFLYHARVRGEWFDSAWTKNPFGISVVDEGSVTEAHKEMWTMSPRLRLIATFTINAPVERTLAEIFCAVVFNPFDDPRTL